MMRTIYTFLASVRRSARTGGEFLRRNLHLIHLKKICPQRRTRVSDTRPSGDIHGLFMAIEQQLRTYSECILALLNFRQVSGEAVWRAFLPLLYNILMIYIYTSRFIEASKSPVGKKLCELMVIKYAFNIIVYNFN